MKNIDEILAMVIRVGLFLVPAAALFVTSSMFFPYITGKAIFFRILVVIVTVLWVILALRNEAYRPKYSVLLLLLSLFTVVTLVAAIFGANPTKSIFSNFERMEGWVLIGHLFFFFLVAVSVFNERKWWRHFFHISLAVSVIVAFSGLREIGDIGRIASTLGNAIYLAVYLLFHMFLAGFFLSERALDLKEKGKGVLADWATYVYSAIIVMELVALFYTGTRGTSLGLVGGALATLIYIAWKEREYTRVRMYAGGALITLVVLIGGFIAVRDAGFVQESPILNRFADISLETDTGQSRILLWGMTLENTTEHPIIGIGQENFNYTFNEHYDPFFYNHEQWFDRTHNVFMEWLSAGGILGFLLYLSFFIMALYYIMRLENMSVISRGILIGLVIGYAIHGLFVFDNLMSYILFFSLLGFLHVAHRREFPEQARTVLAPKAVQYTLGALVIALAGYSFFWVTLPDYGQANTLLKALAVRPDNDRLAEMKLSLYEDAVAYNAAGTQEVRERLLFDANGIRNAPVSDEMKTAFAQLAEGQMLAQIEADPRNARFYTFLGNFYAQWGDHESAVDTYRQAVEYSPQKQTIMIELTESLIALGQYEEAHEVARRTFELEPAFDKARVLYASTALYMDEDDLAEELLVEQFGTEHVVDDTLIRAYSDTGHTDELIATAQRRVELDPNNLQNHISLAAAYVQVGQRGQAIAVLEEVKTLAQGNQNAVAQLDAIIERIERGEEFEF